jgi:hypothetical protein
LVPLALTRAGVLAESDTFWQVRTGLVILSSGAIPAVDPFSWSATGRPWQVNSWAFDVLLALAYRAQGLTAVALAGAALALAAFAAVLLLARHLGATPLAAALVTIPGSVFLVGWLSVRPQLVDYAAVPLLLWLLGRTFASGSATLTSRAGSRERAWAVAGIAGVQAVWVNLHGAAPLGVAIVALAGLAHGVDSRWRGGRPRWLWYAASTGAAALATLANPFGVGVIGQLARVRAESTTIREWGGVTQSGWPELAMLAATALAVVVAWRLGSRWLAVVLAALGLAGIATLRLVPIAFVVALSVLATGLARTDPRAWSRPRRWIVAAGVIAVFAALVVRGAAATTHLGQPNYPLAAIRALPPHCRLFNGYALGGPVTLLRPDIPVSLDSRNDVYGDAAIRSTVELEGGPADAGARLLRLGVTCVLVRPSTGLAERLRGDPDWRELVRERDGVLFVRDRQT